MPPPAPALTSITPGVREDLDGLAQGRTADLHARGELALRRQPIAHAEIADLNGLDDLEERLLERAARADGRERVCARCLPSRRLGDVSALASVAVTTGAPGLRGETLGIRATVRQRPASVDGDTIIMVSILDL